jgi:hypothetical protein
MLMSDPLGQAVFTEGKYKPFAEFTRAEVENRAAELAAAAQSAPLARVGAVARAWAELGREMAAAGVDTVGELEPELAQALGRKAWAIPRSLL